MLGQFSAVRSASTCVMQSLNSWRPTEARILTSGRSATDEYEGRKAAAIGERELGIRCLEIWPAIALYYVKLLRFNGQLIGSCWCQSPTPV